MLTKQHRQTWEIHVSVSCQKHFGRKGGRHQRTAVENRPFRRDGGLPISDRPRAAVHGEEPIRAGRWDLAWSQIIQFQLGLTRQRTAAPRRWPDALVAVTRLWRVPSESALFTLWRFGEKRCSRVRIRSFYVAWVNKFQIAFQSSWYKFSRLLQQKVHFKPLYNLIYLFLRRFTRSKRRSYKNGSFFPPLLETVRMYFNQHPVQMKCHAL